MLCFQHSNQHHFYHHEVDTALFHNKLFKFCSNCGEFETDFANIFCSCGTRFIFMPVSIEMRDWLNVRKFPPPLALQRSTAQTTQAVVEKSEAEETVEETDAEIEKMCQLFEKMCHEKKSFPEWPVTELEEEEEVEDEEVLWMKDPCWDNWVGEEDDEDEDFDFDFDSVG
jgi:hypothetical protein